MYKVKIENNLKSLNKKLQNSKKISLGAWMQISSPSIAGIMASKDFDWVTIDMEHGEFHEINLSSIFNAIENFNKLPFVRVSNKETDKIPNFLDLGAKGILIPKIETKKELIKIISETYFPPHGNRGVSFCRANSYGKYFNEYYKSSINNLIIPMIETKKSLENFSTSLENARKTLEDCSKNAFFFARKTLEKVSVENSQKTLLALLRVDQTVF